jgi:hypothetical protein
MEKIISEDRSKLMDLIGDNKEGGVMIVRKDLLNSVNQLYVDLDSLGYKYNIISNNFPIMHLSYWKGESKNA